MDAENVPIPDELKEHVWNVTLREDRSKVISGWSQGKAGVPICLEVAEGTSTNDVMKFLAIAIDELARHQMHGITVIMRPTAAEAEEMEKATEPTA